MFPVEYYMPRQTMSNSATLVKLSGKEIQDPEKVTQNSTDLYTTNNIPMIAMDGKDYTRFRNDYLERKGDGPMGTRQPDPLKVDYKI